jgi:ABC-2 type transport system ATP-binding protein
MPETTPAPVVAVRDLVKNYKAFRALGPVSFSIGPGATGLLGPNGAGKTTLLKTLLGLVTPSRGSARVLGRDIVGDRLGIRQRIGYMPERDAYVTNLSGVRYVAFMGELAGLPAADAMQRAHEVLNYVGMEEERYRLVDTYSTGMRQKAKLAQALVHDPQLLFLDEPTNGLDPKGRDDMLALIKDITQRHGISVVLSSHLLPDVEAVCRNVVVMNKGAVVAQGGLKALQEVDGREWVVRIKGDEAAFTKALTRRKGRVARDDHHLKVRLEGKAESDLIFEAAREANVQIRHFMPKRSSLEELFMDLVEA